MKKPDIELLRAKLALMSPDDCPPAVLDDARKHFPNALDMLWMAPPAATAGAKVSKLPSDKPVIHRRSRSNAIAIPQSSNLYGPKEPGTPFTKKPAAAGTHRRARSNAMTSLPTFALSTVGQAPAATTKADIASSDTGPDQRSLAQDGTGQGVVTSKNAAQRSLMVSAGVSSGNKTVAMTGDKSNKDMGPQHHTTLPQHGAGPLNDFDVNVPGVKGHHQVQGAESQKPDAFSDIHASTEEGNVPTINSAQNAQSYDRASYQVNAKPDSIGLSENSNKRVINGIANENGGVVAKTDLSMRSTDNSGSFATQGSKKRDHECAVKHDNQSSDKAPKRGTGANANDKYPLAKPRYVVVNGTGWKFREVMSMKNAVDACRQVMPPIDAGNGVKLFVNDTIHNVVLRSMQREARHSPSRKQLTGNAHNRVLIPTERKQNKKWLQKEKYCAIDPADKMWDFSPLWYLFKTKTVQLKKDEEDMRRTGSGIVVNDGLADKERSDVAASPVAEVEGRDQKRRCSGADMAWLLFEDDE